MRKLLVISCFWFFVSVQAEYKRLTDYDDILYSLINEYVTTNSTNSSADVVTYINSSATDTVFSDAKNAGYSRKQLIFAVYQSSFGVANPNKVIIDALHDVNAKENMMSDAVLYGSFANMGITFLSLMGLARFFWLYFRTDRKVLNYYRQNAHRYQTGNGTNTNINTGSASSIATNPSSPLVPEPWFQ